MTHLINHIEEYQVDPKYIRFSESECGRYITVKYSKKAFFDKAWNEFEDLIQARGHTFCKKTGKILSRPFDKVFNYTENDAGLDIKGFEEIVVVDKINGFLGAVTRLEPSEWLIQTSGTACNASDVHATKNDFIRMFSEHLELETMAQMELGCTYLFEVVHKEDPHIVPEKEGLYLIGMRQIRNGCLEQEKILDQIAETLKVYRPVWMQNRFDVAIAASKDVKTEGFMIRFRTGGTVCKIKSKFYLNRKFLARLGPKKALDLSLLQTDDEEVKAMIDAIIETGVDWSSMNDQDRLTFLDRLIPRF